MAKNVIFENRRAAYVFVREHRKRRKARFALSAVAFGVGGSPRYEIRNGFLGALLLIVVSQFRDTRLLTAQIAQIIQLGTTDIATTYAFDRFDARAVKREHAFDAFAIANLAHGKG